MYRKQVTKVATQAQALSYHLRALHGFSDPFHDFKPAVVVDLDWLLKIGSAMENCIEAESLISAHEVVRYDCQRVNSLIIQMPILHLSSLIYLPDARTLLRRRAIWAMNSIGSSSSIIAFLIFLVLLCLDLEKRPSLSMARLKKR